MFHQASSRPHSKCSKHGSHEYAPQGLLICLHAELQKKRKYYRALLFVTGYEPELSENCGECSMQSTSIITCENPRREPNVLKIALSHFKNIIRVQTLLHPVPSTSIVHTSIDYSSSTSTSKLCAWLFASSGSATIIVLLV